MTYWFRLGAHPKALFQYHDFTVDGDLVYPREPGRTTPPRPWFSIRGGLVYPTPDHPHGTGEQPWYELVGSFVYPADGHPDGPGAEPRYQARPAPA
jgi:hypothetical protein